MPVQTNYKIRADAAKPRTICLKLEVTSMDEHAIEKLKGKLNAFASDLKDEFGVEYKVEDGQSSSAIKPDRPIA